MVDALLVRLGPDQAGATSPLPPEVEEDATDSASEGGEAQEAEEDSEREGGGGSGRSSGQGSEDGEATAAAAAAAAAAERGKLKRIASGHKRWSQVIDYKASMAEAAQADPGAGDGDTIGVGHAAGANGDRAPSAPQGPAVPRGAPGSSPATLGAPGPGGAPLGAVPEHGETLPVAAAAVEGKEGAAGEAVTVLLPLSEPLSDGTAADRAALEGYRRGLGGGRAQLRRRTTSNQMEP